MLKIVKMDSCCKGGRKSTGRCGGIKTLLVVRDLTVSLYIDKDKSTDMGKCDSVEAQLRTAEIITLQEVPSLDR